MDFGDALRALKTGQRVSRQNWNAPGQWVALQVPDDHSKMSRPYFYLRTADSKLVPWVPTASDALADDWFVA